MAFSLLAARGRRNGVVLGTFALIAASVVGLLLVAQFRDVPTTEATGPTGAGAMSLSVENNGGSCDDATNPTKCDLPLGSSFDLVVTIDDIPYNPQAIEVQPGLPPLPSSRCDNGIDDDGDGFIDEKDIDCAGYLVVQSFIDYGIYDPTASEDGAGAGTCSDNVDNGPDNSKDRFDTDCVDVLLIYKKDTAANEVADTKDCGSLLLKAQTGQLGLVNHSCISGASLVEPQPDDYVGPFVTLAFNCSAEASVTEVQLRPLDGPPASGSGAGFQHSDGITEFPASDTLTINCVESLPTPTPTPTLTPCPGGKVPFDSGCGTPTPTPTPSGPGGLTGMSLNVEGGVCDDPGNPTKCFVAPGGRFTITVEVVGVPAGGYTGIQTFIDYGSDLVYKKALSAEDEIVWPDLDPTFDARFQAGPGRVGHFGLTGFPPAPVSTFVGTVVEIAMNCSALQSSTEVELVPPGDPRLPVAAAGTLFVLPDDTLAPTSDTLTINCSVPVRKAPRLQNLFLTRQGDKLPPVQCVGPQGGNDVAVFTHQLTAPINSPDPNGSGEPQQLGAFEFEVHYDQSKVCVELQPGPAAANMTCFVQDDVTKPVLEGVARIGCVTIGKTGFPDTTTPEGRHLADVLVRPQPDVYSQAIPNQGNGVVAQLLNQKCELADLQGHPIALFSCEDADVTIRYLEGDVEPDCVVNTLDTQAIAFRWGASKGDLLFLDRFNLEPFGTQTDDDIDINDVQVVYGRIGSTCAAPHPPQPPVNPKG